MFSLFQKHTILFDFLTCVPDDWSVTSLCSTWTDLTLVLVVLIFFTVIAQSTHTVVVQTKICLVIIHPELMCF